MSDAAVKTTEFDREEMIVHLVRMRTAGHVFAVYVDTVTDVLHQIDITPIPTSPSEVVGALNLRGRIVIVIDLQTRLNLHADNTVSSRACLVVEHEGELYGLLVDEVLEVMDVDEEEIQPWPQNLSPGWLEVASGVYPLGEELVVVLQTPLLFSNR